MQVVGKKRFKTGDSVVYTKPKSSTRPGPRAKEISPAKLGETYSYVVDKFWVVAAPEADDGTVLLKTRRGKTLRVAASDANLHRASLWQRLVHRSRFPRLNSEATADQSENVATN